MKKRLSCILLIAILIGSIININTVQAANFNIDFETKTESISLINLDTDTVVFEKNTNQKEVWRQLQR